MEQNTLELSSGLTLPNEISAILEDLNNLDAPLEEPAVRDLLERLSQQSPALSSFERFNNDVYQRNRIIRTDHVDLLLLCWRAGQRTPIHNHAGSTCGVYVVRGEGTEISFAGSNVLVPCGIQQVRAGDITVCRDEDIHLLANFSSRGEDLVTLHCYSPPLAKMRVFDQSETFFAEYDTVTQRAATSGCYEVPLAVHSAP